MKTAEYVLTILAEANTELASQLVAEIVEDLETEAHVSEWLGCFHEAESLGTMDADQRAYCVDAVVGELASVAIDDEWGGHPTGVRTLAAQLAAELGIIRETREEAMAETDEAWEARLGRAKSLLLSRYGEGEAARVLQSDADAYNERVRRGHEKIDVVRDGRRSTYDDRPAPGTPAGRVARKGVRLSPALHDSFVELARDAIGYAAHFCGWAGGRELAMDIVVGALAGVEPAAASELVRIMRPAVPQAVRSALVQQWQRFAASRGSHDFEIPLSQERLLERTCDAMGRAQRRLAGMPEPPHPARDADVMDVARELLTWNSGRRGQLDRRLMEEPRFFERVWPLIDMHMRGVFAFDVLGAPRPPGFPPTSEGLEVTVREFVADRRPLPCAVDDAGLESMWEEVSAG